MSGVTTVPVRASDVEPGEVLAANQLVGPRGALIIDAYYTDDTKEKVSLHVLDCPAWPLERAEIAELTLEYDAGHVLNVVIAEQYR